MHMMWMFALLCFKNTLALKGGLLLHFAAMAADEVALGKKLLELKEKPGLTPNGRMEAIVECLQSAGLCYKATLVPTDFVIHPYNRGGSMVNCHDVHQKGQQIVDMGVRPLCLVDSMAIEVSSDTDTRESQLNANRDLVAKSNGMLAAVLGTERLFGLINYFVLQLHACFEPFPETCQVHDYFFFSHNSFFQSLHASVQESRWDSASHGR